MPRRFVPHSVTELEEFFEEIRKHHVHVDGFEVSDLRLIFHFDTAARMAHVPEYYLPLKSALVKDAEDLVARHWREIHWNVPMSRSDLFSLFLCIDPSGH